MGTDGLVHHGETVSGEAVLIGKRGQQNLVAGLQAATAALEAFKESLTTDDKYDGSRAVTGAPRAA